MIKKIRKLLGTCFLAAVLAVGSTVGVEAAVDTEATADSYPVDTDSWENWPQAPAILGVTGCLMDCNTGSILYAKGMDIPRFPASITKIMTALLVVENADLNAQVAFTETGLADAYGGSSNINPQIGEVFTVDQMLQMLLVKSANDVATQLGEYIGGSVDGFAERMNQRAAEIGCTNTHFANASGLENDDHYTTAHDMALIMRTAIQYDRIREIMNTQSISIPETNLGPARYYDTHLLMLVPGNEYYYEGALGGKTGYTPISGCTLVMYATRGDRTLIGVVMGGGDSNLICTDMADLFDYGFNSFAFADMTGGNPYVSGGTALLPVGMDPSVVNQVPTETPEGVTISYVYNGQNLGSGLMTKEAYDSWQASLNPQPEGEAVTDGETAAADGDAADSDARSEEREKHRSGKVIGMYIAITVLAISIIACIILLIITSDRVQRKLHRQKKDRDDEQDKKES